jgi:hypothetical protein
MRNLFFFMLLFSKCALACSDFHWEWKAEDWVQKPDSIYYGMVASISLGKESIYNGETDPVLNAVSLRGKKHITLKVYESLKGERARVVKATLPECIGGVAAFGESVLLFKVGKVWHVKNKENYSEIFKYVAGSLSKHNSEPKENP